MKAYKFSELELNKLFENQKTIRIDVFSDGVGLNITKLNTNLKQPEPWSSTNFLSKADALALIEMLQKAVL